MRGTKKSSEPRAPGAFLSSGSFSESAETRHRGHIHGLVRALVSQRRRGDLTLPLAVAAIRAANATDAFPNHAQWETCTTWPMAYTSTSAEEAVKRGAGGTDGHWCGEMYAAGHMHECSEDRHRPVRCPPGPQRDLDTLFDVHSEPGLTGPEAPPPLV